MFKDLRRGSHLSEKQLNYYSFKYKRACNLGKLYLYLKYIKGCIVYQEDWSFLIVALPHRKHQNFLIIIWNLSWRVVGLTLAIQEIFIDKINRIKNIPKGAILVTTDVIGLYPCIPHVAGLKALKNTLDAMENKSVLTEKLLKRA